MKAVRLRSVRNAGWLKKCYAALKGTHSLFNPLLKALGHERLDKPFAAAEGLDLCVDLIEQVSEIGGVSPCEMVEAVARYAYEPVLTCTQNSKRWGEVAQHQVTDHYYTFLSRATILVGQMKGETRLPMPLDDVPMPCCSPGKDVCAPPYAGASPGKDVCAPPYAASCPGLWMDVVGKDVWGT